MTLLERLKTLQYQRAVSELRDYPKEAIVAALEEILTELIARDPLPHQQRLTRIWIADAGTPFPDRDAEPGPEWTRLQ